MGDGGSIRDSSRHKKADTQPTNNRKYMGTTFFSRVTTTGQRDLGNYMSIHLVYRTMKVQSPLVCCCCSLQGDWVMLMMEVPL